MYTQLADYCTGKLLDRGIIQREGYDIYHYGIELGISNIICLVSTLALGIILHMYVESFLVFGCFKSLRVYVGGINAPGYLRCYAVSMLVTAIILILSAVFVEHALIWPIFAAGAIGAAAIVLLSPVPDYNKLIDEKEYIVYKRRARISLVFWMSVCAGFLYYSSLRCSATIALSLLSIGTTAFLGIVKTKKASPKIAQ